MMLRAEYRLELVLDLINIQCPDYEYPAHIDIPNIE